ncbi:GNAT family N-acetyltransferase [Peptacetobacter hominis]|uniref:GNAT family N-acetyltransferase n=1 Tax=Peptacetobacter hominis TaxID=2743610 RepID=A0A544QU85_9FIRM|nr:GNAT family N-acetyltransferase [Peptacetobacter hominis]
MEIKNLNMRTATENDIERIAEIEKECFPEAEAATKESIKERVKVFGESFIVAEYDEEIIGFINGAITNQKTITDDMFEDASLHNPDGIYQSIFGLDVVEKYRKNGVARALMNIMIDKSKERGKTGLILTCKEKLIDYYSKFGYKNMGVSESVHGGAVWYDMILKLK